MPSRLDKVAEDLIRMPQVQIERGVKIFDPLVLHPPGAI